MVERASREIKEILSDMTWFKYYFGGKEHYLKWGLGGLAVLGLGLFGNFVVNKKK